MQIGMIGLGRMGAGMVTRWLRGGHHCVVHDHAPEGMARLVALGATGTASLQLLVERLQPPRAVWLMVPAAAVDGVLGQLAALLQPGDIVIDGGNSCYHDDLRRAAALAAAGIAYVDVGTSGGIAGLGHCHADLQGSLRVVGIAALAAARRRRRSPAAPALGEHGHQGSGSAGQALRANGGARNRDREFEIAETWHEASIPRREIDRDLANRCFIKGGYCLEPDTWDDSTIKQKGIAFSQVLSATEELLGK